MIVSLRFRAFLGYTEGTPWGGGEMADAGDLKSSGLITRAGSSPARPTSQHGLGPHIKRMPAIERKSVAGIFDTNCTPIT